MLAIGADGCRRRNLPSGLPAASTSSSRAACSTRSAALLARGVPEHARPFGGLVYRQALEHLHGVRDEAATRALIAQENRRYARRQLIWFRKEPDLTWFDGPGESSATTGSMSRRLEDNVECS